MSKSAYVPLAIPDCFGCFGISDDCGDNCPIYIECLDFTIEIEIQTNTAESYENDA